MAHTTTITYEIVADTSAEYDDLVAHFDDLDPVGARGASGRTDDPTAKTITITFTANYDPDVGLSV